jgi:hypothetical protein
MVMVVRSGDSLVVRFLGQARTAQEGARPVRELRQAIGDGASHDAVVTFVLHPHRFLLVQHVKRSIRVDSLKMHADNMSIAIVDARDSGIKEMQVNVI